MVPSVIVDRLPSSPKHFIMMFQRMFPPGLALRASEPQGFHFLQPGVTPVAAPTVLSQTFPALTWRSLGPALLDTSQ